MLAGNTAYMPPAFESIATASGSGVSSVTFSSIPATYAHLQIRAISQDNNNSELRLQFNADTATNYSWHNIQAIDSNSTSATGGASSTSIRYAGFSSGTANFWCANIIDIHEYANTARFKTSRSFFGYSKNVSGQGIIWYASGNWRSNSAITSITILNGDSVNWNSGTTFELYGIAG
jgi:hypothetical protein